MSQDKIADSLQEHVLLLENAFQGQAVEVGAMAERMVETFHQGGRLLVGGSGSLAAVANLIANLFLHRLNLDRPLLPAVSLGENHTLAAALLREDRGQQFLVRQVRALAGEGDMLLLLADAHRDPALDEALSAARQLGCATALVLQGTEMNYGQAPDFLFRLATDSPPRAVEGTLFLGHLLCELVESELFGF